MRIRRVISVLLTALTLFLSTGSVLAEDVPIPAPIGDIYVQDFAGILDGNQKAELVRLGRSIEDRTTAQVAVLIVDTIGDRTIEDFSNEAYREFGIGSAQENNGVLLVLSMQERKARIEVGYGLEGRIPDGKAGRIIDEYAIPYLKNGRPDLAVTETYKVLAKEVLAEYGIEGGEGGQKAVETADEGIGIPSWLLILIVLVVVFLDFKFFGGTLTYLLLSIISRGGGRGGGGSRGGGGGSSGGGGASRGW